MPFCSNCGNQVGERNRFCAKCGAVQPGPGGAHPVPGDPLAALTPRTASILCYVPWIGWIIAIVVLAAEKFRADRFVRFHAFQALYLFVAWLMDDWVVRPMMFGVPHFRIDRVIEALLLGASIFMMVKASHNEEYALPLFGELAHRSVSEH